MGNAIFKAVHMFTIADTYCNMGEKRCHIHDKQRSLNKGTISTALLTQYPGALLGTDLKQF